MMHAHPPAKYGLNSIALYLCTKGLQVSILKLKGGLIVNLIHILFYKLLDQITGLFVLILKHIACRFQNYVCNITSLNFLNLQIWKTIVYTPRTSVKCVKRVFPSSCYTHQSIELTGPARSLGCVCKWRGRNWRHKRAQVSDWWCMQNVLVWRSWICQ